MKKRLFAFAAAVVAAAPLHAVGMGPLVKEGLTDSPDKGFYLTLINPYAARTDFQVYAVGADDENPAVRVQLQPQLSVAAQAQRRFLVIAHGLQPGETYRFRVCASRIETQEVAFNVRVCSRLSARRVPARV